jgi:hypothetical protein
MQGPEHRATPRPLARSGSKRDGTPTSCSSAGGEKRLAAASCPRCRSTATRVRWLRFSTSVANALWSACGAPIRPPTQVEPPYHCPRCDRGLRWTARACCAGCGELGAEEGAHASQANGRVHVQSGPRSSIQGHGVCMWGRARVITRVHRERGQFIFVARWGGVNSTDY